jgi:ABC-2 type transport system permease protein
MRKIFKIAEREFLETVKTKAFILSLVLTPVLIVGLLFITNRAQKSMMGPRPTKTIAVTDLTHQLGEEIQAKIAEYNKSNPERKINFVLRPYANEETMKSDLELKMQQVREGKLDAWFVLYPGADQFKAGSRAYMQPRNLGDLELFSSVRNLIDGALNAKRFREHNVPPQLIADLYKQIPIDQVDVTVGQKRDPMAFILVPFFFSFLMFIGVFGTNQHMLTSVIEEKNSRVMEVLLSAVSPFQLMAGKIFGLAAVGIVLVVAWGGTAMSVAIARGLMAVMPPILMVYFVIYFILGFLLISSFLAAIGSACNTMKEAQTLMGPITMLLVIPLVIWFYIAQYPDGVLAVSLSFIPPITPTIMILRLVANPDTARWQIVATILLLAASVPVVMWASAKVFRTGILMYGKPPSLRELFRWLQYR